MIKKFLPVILLFAFDTALTLAHEHHSPSQNNLDSSRPPALHGESIYNVDATWTTQDARDVSLKSLRGRPVVAAMVYTSCQAACPMTISDLKKIEEGLSEPAKKQVIFAVFSFDSDRDKPGKLKDFAKARSIDLSRWTLFHGSPSAVRKLAAVLGIRYRKEKSGEFDHSNVVTVLDRDGVISYQQVGLRSDPQGAITKLNQLAETKNPN